MNRQSLHQLPIRGFSDVGLRGTQILMTAAAPACAEKHNTPVTALRVAWRAFSPFPLFSL
jgi:hypothetical protein